MFVLRDTAGYPTLETADAEEFVAAIDEAKQQGEEVHWDDQDTLSIEQLRDSAASAREHRKHVERLRRDGVLLRDGTLNPDHPENQPAS